MIVKIFLPSTEDYWIFPFYFYSNCIKHILADKNILCKIVEKEEFINENDLFILFQVFSGNLTKHYKNVILINSESFFTGDNNPINIKNILKKKINIKKIFEYSYKNILNIKKITNIPVMFCPPMYCPIFENKVNNNQEKEFDILFYGIIHGRRTSLINELKKKYKIKIFRESNYEKLFDYMGKSKLIIIIHSYDFSFHYDFYRIAFLLINKIFFIHEEIEEENKKITLELPMFNSINLLNECNKYLNMSQLDRDNLCVKNYENLKKNFNLADHFTL